VAKKKVIILSCIAVIIAITAFGGARLHQHIMEQRELEYIMEQERRLNQLYFALNGLEPLRARDPMEIPQVIISLAGLRSIGFSQEELEYIWMNSEDLGAQHSTRNHPDYNEASTFIFEGGVGAFSNALLAVYQENFEVIRTQFLEYELVYAKVPSSLPASVIREVIRIFEEENPPPERRARVEEEPEASAPVRDFGLV
jgi:hypothetical protein